MVNLADLKSKFLRPEQCCWTISPHSGRDLPLLTPPSNATCYFPAIIVCVSVFKPLFFEEPCMDMYDCMDVMTFSLCHVLKSVPVPLPAPFQHLTGMAAFWEHASTTTKCSLPWVLKPQKKCLFAPRFSNQRLGRGSFSLNSCIEKI